MSLPDDNNTLPVSVITGYLGSGKTTVLNHVLKHPDMADTAVIVNEFGEVGIDHLLVETALDATVLLEGGCVCCSVRGDLVDTLDRLRIQRERGDIPAFRRVAIETTGLADPAPVLQTLMREPTVLRHYRLAGMVATVDAANGLQQLDTEPEALKQAALAGRLLLTKTDIARPGAAETLERRLARLNPAAPVIRVEHGRAEPGMLFDDGRYDPALAGADWVGADAYDGQGHARHGDDIRSFCLIRERPLPWRAVRTWLESVTSLRGADLLRVKGIVNVAGESGPVILHGVQHVFHPPRRLSAWPNGDRRTRIVCIARGIERDELANALDAAVEYMATHSEII